MPSKKKIKGLRERGQASLGTCLTLRTISDSYRFSDMDLGWYMI